MKQFKSFAESQLKILSLCLVVLYYFISSFGRVVNLDYCAINGTFQNYNVIRRFIDGQVPFVDFTVYLGTGHLLITSAITVLFGGNYAASVLAYDFVSSLSVIFMCYGICSVRFPKNWLIPALLSVYIRYYCPAFIFFDFFKGELCVEYVFNSIVTGGNSARNIRALILPVCISLYIVVSRYLESHSNWSESQQLYSHVLAGSCLSGLAFVWGNDYGIVCCISICVLVIILTLFRYRSFIKLLKTINVWIIGTGFTILCVSSLVTRGHSLIWFKNNFSSSDYQSWYFNKPDEHIFYYYNIDFSPSVLYCALGLLLYLGVLLKEVSWIRIRKYGVVVFALLSCLGAAEEYKLFGGGGLQFHDFLIATIQIIVYIEILSLCFWILRKTILINTSLKRYALRVWRITALWGLIVILLHGTTSEFYSIFSNSVGFYNEKLGGMLLACADDLDKSQELIGYNKVFSDYASALEVVTDQYQPTGTDYIIHCLTDNARQRYLDIFNKQEFEYVSTIKLNYNKYSPWIRNANWFFYREVYKKYHIVGSNTYADYWEQGISCENIYDGDITVDIQKVSNTNYQVNISTPVMIDGIADVYVDYCSNVKKGRSSFLLKQNIVGVFPEIRHRGVNDWCLRPVSKEFIPIEIKNGEGSVNIVSYPEKATTLTISEVKCSRIFRPY